MGLKRASNSFLKLPHPRLARSQHALHANIVHGAITTAEMTGTCAHRGLRLDEVLKGGAGIVRLAEIRDDADALREGGRPRRLRRAEAQLPAQSHGGVSAPGAGRFMGSGFEGNCAKNGAR